MSKKDNWQIATSTMEVPMEPETREKETLTAYVGDSLYDFSRYYTKHLKGKLLTLVDAIIADKEQSKAIKDIISQMLDNELWVSFNDCINNISSVMAEVLGEGPIKKNVDIPKLEYTYERKIK